MAASLKGLRQALGQMGGSEGNKKLVGTRWYSPGTLVAMGFLVILTLYFLTPLWYLMLSTTKNNTDLLSSNGLWFARFNLVENLQQLFAREDGIFLVWMKNTVIYAVGGATIGTLISVMTGYALAKYPFRGRSLIFGLVLGAVLVPSTTLALPIYMLESKLGIINWGILAFLLPNLVNPLGIFLARVYANASINDDLIAAARMDGASETRIFTRVGLPILVPGMVTIFLFQFVAIWNNFFLALVLISDNKYYPVNLGLTTWNFDPASHELLYNLIMTGSFLSIIPLIVMFLFLQRYWRAGLTFGSVVG
jgi:multiple sugar transport system permease protein